MSDCCYDVDGGVAAGEGGGGGGSAFLTKIDTSALTNVQIDLRFEDDLTDSSANGLDLTATATVPRYMTHRSGLRGVWAPGIRNWERTVNDAALTITGDLTVHFLGVLSNLAASKLFVFAPSGGGGEGEADNWLYSLQLVSGGGTQPILRYFAETGGGANIQVDWDILVPEDSGLLSMTREDDGGGTDTLTLYWNGAQLADQKTTVVRPSGGTNGRLALNDVSGSPGWAAWYMQFVIQSEALAAADVLEIAQQVGVAPA